MKKSIIDGAQVGELSTINMETEAVHKTNTEFWNTIGSEFLGVTALPEYGGFVTEESLHLLENITDKTVLEIGCGNGHSLEYMSNIGAGELWGIDIAPKQIERTKEYLLSKGINVNLVCASMESECGLPKEYFDLVYAVYAIGWATNLDKTFSRISSYLKKDGIFIFSWSHPIHKCVNLENDLFVFNNSYFDEDWYSVGLSDKEIMLSNRKLSTYINALAENGFKIEKLIEDNDENLIKNSDESDFKNKAKILPVTFVIKARKL